MSQGTLYIVSAPSGAGKTSLLARVLADTPELVLSVSHTTRAPRPGERSGTHYYFVDHARFEAMIAEGAFLEYARVFDNYYGTSRAAVLRQLEQGRDVVLEIDWQGAQQVRAAFPGVVSIFILPPSRTALEQRLRSRAQDSEAVIQRRLAGAVTEMSHYGEYDYLVVNDDFDTAVADLRAIVRSGRLAAHRQIVHLRELLAGLTQRD
ncbi:MAG TPA: guanylate kinase [Gammaproteobacteria bacterium]|nr:guanylate kinase [Gammaproteobacteria bacterium]